MSVSKVTTKTGPLVKQTPLFTACDECRRRKTKCDGDKPICVNCKKKGIDCVYHERVRSRSRARLSDVKNLQKEVELLKVELQIKDSAWNPGTNVELASIHFPTDDFNQTANSFDYYELDMKVSSTNSQVYYMLKQGHRWLVEDQHFQDAIRDISLIQFHNLMEFYWKYENVSIMIIWKRIFLSDLLSVQDGGKYSSKSLILSVLALGATFTRNKKLIVLGKELAKVAKRFLRAELWDPKITTPQTLCLLCMYEHSKGHSTEELYLSKLAVNIALQLELNLENTVDTDPFNDEDDITVRRFLWWSCYQVDMLVCTVARIAPMIRKEITGVNPPQVSPLKYLLGSPERRKESYFEFVFISTITLELFVICGETLRVCYGNLPGITDEYREYMVTKADEELHTFWKTARQNFGELPEQYKSPQVLTFKLRYYFSVIVIVGYFIQPQMDPPNAKQMDDIELCVKCTRKLLYVLQQYDKLHGVHTCETFIPHFIKVGMTMIFCAITYDVTNQKNEYYDYLTKFLKLLLSTASDERYVQNLQSVKLLATNWDVCLM